MFKFNRVDVIAQCEKSCDGMVCSMCCSMCDSKAWQHIDNIWLDFVTDPHNIRLGLVLDGVNLYANLSTNHSTWLILLLNYNLSPWLSTKFFFVMLMLLIPGK